MTATNLSIIDSWVVWGFFEVIQETPTNTKQDFPISFANQTDHLSSGVPSEFGSALS